MTAESKVNPGRRASRVGMGFDVHAFSPDPQRRLILGGVLIEGGRGLVGHSDADVIVHAVADSLLGAAGLGDIGMHFPDSDPAWAGADSLVLLERVIDLVGHAGWRATNVDAVVVAEEPMLARWRPLMQVAMSEVVDAPVTVKGKRAEGLGSIGRSEGIACWAVALIEGIDP